ncbi:MAG: DUF6538 domain-containing protein [Pseudomonadota bacterium]
MRKEDRHLENRNGRWYYQRRVPKRFKPYDDRGVIKTALKTDSIEVARFRRDALEAADDDYWNSMLFLEDGEVGESDANRFRETLERRYRAASSRALARGFVYAPIEQIVDTADLSELLDRINVVKSVDKGRPSCAEEVEAEAMLGTAEEPPVPISKAMEIYQTKIALPRLIKKSPEQKQLWKATLDRSLRYFVEEMGDLGIAEITREHGQKYFEFWNGKVMPEDENSKPISPKTAARHFGDIRNLYTEYFKYLGEEQRQNPFRNLNFKTRRGKKTRKHPPFPDKWVREKLLTPEALNGISREIALSTLMIVETGCRPSEIINLRPEDIVLDHDVPHLVIADRDDREVKTETSVRKIPLVGVSLEAAKRAPNGFPKYHDKSNSFSAAASAAYRRRGLFPTKRHVIYSFRHSFEDRMKEAHIDFELRTLLMGHSTERPEYGTGGSLAYRRDELLKIAHPFPPEMLASF